MRAQRGTAAIVRNLEQIIVGETEQRAAQHGGEREIVLRQQQRVGERHQVHHRDVLGEHEAVGARDRDALVLQRADDGLEQRAALAHQHQDVARPHRLALGRPADRRAALDQAAHRARDALRKLYARRGFAGRIERCVPAFDPVLLGRRQNRSQISTRLGAASGSATCAGKTASVVTLPRMSSR